MKLYFYYGLKQVESIFLRIYFLVLDVKRELTIYRVRLGNQSLVVYCTHSLSLLVHSIELIGIGKSAKENWKRKIICPYIKKVYTSIW